MIKKLSDAALQLIRVASTFGLTLGINIYLLAVLLGGWLDRQFNTAPLCRLLLLLVALASSFLFLYRQLVAMEQMEKQREDEDEREGEE